MPVNRASFGRVGVWPPRLNQAMPSVGASPATRMLSATPDTTWSPRWVIVAKPWIMESPNDVADPGQQGPRNQAEPVTAAGRRRREGRRPASCPRARCRRRPTARENRPASAARISGVETRRVRVQDQDEEGEVSTARAPYSAAGRPFLPRRRAPGGGRSLRSGAGTCSPAHRRTGSTSPWITTTISRVSLGISNASFRPSLVRARRTAARRTGSRPDGCAP